MVYSDVALDHAFGALADPTRRAIVARLASGESTVGELARPFSMSLQAVGKHLVVLERAHLVERWRDGRMRRVRLAPAALRGVTNWLDDYRRLWEGQLDRLATHLGELPRTSHTHRITETYAWPPSPPRQQPPTPSASSGGSGRRRNASSKPGRRQKN